MSERSETAALQKLDRARQLLAKIDTVEDGKQLRDQAEAMRVYVKQQKYSLECQNYCVEIKLRAERRVGELLVETAQSGQRAVSGDKQSGRGKRPLSKPTLADLGVTKGQSSEWQRLASIDEESFNGWIQDMKAGGDQLTTTRLLVDLFKRDKSDRSKTWGDMLANLAVRIEGCRNAVKRMVEMRDDLWKVHPEEMAALIKSIIEADFGSLIPHLERQSNATKAAA